MERRNPFKPNPKAPKLSAAEVKFNTAAT